MMLSLFTEPSNSFMLSILVTVILSLHLYMHATGFFFFGYEIVFILSLSLTSVLNFSTIVLIN